MASSKSRSKKRLSLTRGRPPTSKSTPTLSSKATRSLIRSHHQLGKCLSQALAKGDQRLADDVSRRIADQGGLKSYQLASKTGQSGQRGGDSSVVLVGWLRPFLSAFTTPAGEEEKLRILEVGALSAGNAISKAPGCQVTRIDLHSQEKGRILRQDFMEMPLPVNDAERFHVISLSLVLNYVPDADGRGEMLSRTTRFLCNAPRQILGMSRMIPCVFLVLPAPCVTNSRYLTKERLEEVLNSLGYDIVEEKTSSKLVYYLLHFEPNRKTNAATFKKVELRPGRRRNNFAITLR